MRHDLAAAAIGLLLLGSAAPAAAAEVLITQAEAALPAVPDSGMSLRGITRGPGIEQISPDPAARTLHAPLPLKIKFVARNNETIDKDSVKVTYLKAPAVDLTARLKPFLTDDGIEMKEADMPAGTHLLRVDLKDSRGRASTMILKLIVEGK
jgi:hypothetical protein